MWILAINTYTQTRAFVQSYHEATVSHVKIDSTGNGWHQEMGIRDGTSCVLLVLRVIRFQDELRLGSRASILSSGMLELYG